VSIPPLRERGEDIVKLAEWFLERIAARHRLPLRHLSASGRSRLRAHHWPGNVRELAHELERALVFEEGAELHLAQLPGGVSDLAPGQPVWLKPGFVFPEAGFSLDEAVNRFIQQALAQAGGNVSAAARLLGVPRDFVRYRLGQKTKKEDGN
jgi:DNA-binding NtrC family response regulator